MRSAIAQWKLSDTLTLSECHPTSDHRGAYWLYDKTRGFNLAMGAETREAALLEALDYYQKRLAEVETKRKALSQKVESFIAQFPRDDYNEDEDED